MIDHKDMVSKLAKPGSEIIKTLLTRTIDILHMGVGIQGEVIELFDAIMQDKDEKVVINELGDIEFYFEGLCQAMQLEVPSTVPDEITIYEEPLSDLIIASGMLLDNVKKYAFNNNHSKLHAIQECMLFVRGHLDRLYVYGGYTREEAIAANIEKLGARYEGFKYSDDAAQQRKDVNG